MNELQIFTSPVFGQVRTITEGGKTLFCGVDIAKPLAYSRPSEAVARHCPHTLKRRIGVQTGTKADGTPAMQEVEMMFITEGDVYRLIARSNLPEAQKFESWIFDEVVPSIRKNGGYIAGQESLTDTELLAKAFLVAQRTIDERNARIRELEARNEANAPKVIFADAVSASGSSILIGDLAKLLKQNGVENMGQNRLFDWMRKNGYLIRRKGTNYNMPTQRSMEMGLFRVKETAVTHSDGHVTVNKTPKVSGKGQRYFINLFLSSERQGK